MPNYDPALLDELARVYVRAAVDALFRDSPPTNAKPGSVSAGRVKSQEQSTCQSESYTNHSSGAP